MNSCTTAAIFSASPATNRVRYSDSDERVRIRENEMTSSLPCFRLVC